MLQVTLDDAGVDPAIDLAISDLVRQGLAKSVSLLVNYPGCEAVVESFAPFDTRIGLHFNISSGAALGKTASTLVDSGGKFNSPRRGLAVDSAFSSAISAHVEYLDSAVAKEDVIGEFIAQHQRFVQLVGRIPDFINVHHDLDRSHVVRTAISSAIDSLPARQSRLESGGLKSYTSLFCLGGEDIRAYQSRVRQLLLQWSADQEGWHLAVFHPSKGRPSSEFTVYQAGRLNEYQALTAEPMQQLLREAHPEIG